MITVHHLSNSHSHVVLWLLEELGEPYEIVHHQRDPQTARSPASLRAIHPAAKSPTIVDQGVTMIESAGIILYILEAYGKGRLRPAPGSSGAMTFLQWLTFIEGSAKGPLLAHFMTGRLPPEDMFRKNSEDTAKMVFTQIERGLDGNETIVPGQFTAADIQLTFFEELMEAWGRIAAYPNMQRHLAAMRQRAAYKRAEAKGGPVGQKELFSGVISKVRQD
jgi:glutathione S-transferase